MASVSPAARSYPKRKKARVSYYEASSAGESDTGESSDAVEDSILRKVRPKGVRHW
jgi:hypothetical protein